MLDLLTKYRETALVELAQAEDDRKAKQGEVNARTRRIATRLQLLNELPAEVSQTGDIQRTEQTT